MDAARLATDLPVTLWSAGTHTRWTTDWSFDVGPAGSDGPRHRSKAKAAYYLFAGCSDEGSAFARLQETMAEPATAAGLPSTRTSMSAGRRASVDVYWTEKGRGLRIEGVHPGITRERGGLGAGPEVHGFPGSTRTFRHVVPGLSQAAFVITPDLPGFGESDPLPEASFPAFGQAVSELLDWLAIGPCYVYLHDFGAPVGFHIAMRAPDRVLGLIIQNANAHRTGLGPPNPKARPPYARNEVPTRIAQDRRPWPGGQRLTGLRVASSVAGRG